MPEGLSAAEVGKELGEHEKHDAAHRQEPHDRWLSIVEALLLSIVAVLAAYSGYAAAKWGTESSVTGVRRALQSEPRRHRRDSDPHARLRVVRRLVHRLHGRRRQ